MKSSKIILYTDGACLGNPGPGGYGIVLLSSQHRKELAAGFRLTTNNRMELMAAIVGLESIKPPSCVTLFSDSEYLVNAVTKGWLTSWHSRGWVRGKREKVLNVDLWKRLLPLLQKHQVEFSWVRGHAGNKENERCDALSRSEASKKNLQSDTAYENSDQASIPFAEDE